jgi:hypothetical protein
LICLKHDKKPVPSIIFQVLRTLNWIGSVW